MEPSRSAERKRDASTGLISVMSASKNWPRDGFPSA